MKHILKSAFMLLVSGCLAVSCSKGNKSEADPPAPGGKGIISGKITNAAGQPVAGAKVYAGHDTYYNTNVIGVTNEAGQYSLDMKGQPAGTWSVHAELTKRYNGETYVFRLDASNTDPLTTSEGGTRDMEWLLTGVIPGSTDDTRVGGYVTFFRWSDEFIPIQEIQLTLTPEGPLVDGTTGLQIVKAAEIFPTQLNGLWNYEGLRDIPVGRYTISAVHKLANGTETKMLIKKHGDQSYHDNVTADFHQEAPYNFQEIALELTTATP